MRCAPRRSRAPQLRLTKRRFVARRRERWWTAWSGSLAARRGPRGARGPPRRGGGGPAGRLGRAEAAGALRRIQLGERALNGKGDGPAQALLAADIKRFLERAIEPIRTPTTYDAPPGAPIGDAAIDWLPPR